MRCNIAIDYEEIPADIARLLSEANVFFQKSFFEYQKTHGKECVYIYDDHRIIPLIINHVFFFTYGYLPSEPYVFRGAMIEEASFLNRLIDVSKSLKIDWIGQTPTTALFVSAPEGAVSIPFGSHLIDLTQPEDDLWNKLHGKHRNVIRRAIKDEIQVVMGNEELLPIYSFAEEQTMKRSGIDFTGRDLYIQEFKEYKDCIKVFLAYKDRSIQGGAIVLYNKAIGYYIHGASIDNPSTGSMNLLQWEIIKHLKELKIKSIVL